MWLALSVRKKLFVDPEKVHLLRCPLHTFLQRIFRYASVSCLATPCIWSFLRIDLRVDLLHNLLRNSTAVLRFPQFSSRILNTFRKLGSTAPCIEIARDSSARSLVKPICKLLIENPSKPCKTISSKINITG